LTIDINKDPNNYKGYLVPNNTYRPPIINAIRFYNAVDCLIENVKILNPWANAITLQTTIDGIETKNNIIRNCTILMQEWYRVDEGKVNYQIMLPHPSVPDAGAMVGIQLTSHSNFETNNGAACYDDNTKTINAGGSCNDASKININYNDGSYIPSRTYNNTITGCTIVNGSHCVALSNCRNNLITNCTIRNGSNRGIILSSRSMNNTITQNNVSFCGSTGVHLCYGSSSNIVKNNTVTSTRGGEGDGIKSYVNCNNNVIEYNVVSDCPTGIRVAHGANYNTIKYNNITGNNKPGQTGIKILANTNNQYNLDKLKYGDKLTAIGNVCTDNTIINMSVPILVGDDMQFPNSVKDNVVENNKIEQKSEVTDEVIDKTNNKSKVIYFGIGAVVLYLLYKALK